MTNIPLQNPGTAAMQPEPDGDPSSQTGLPHALASLAKALGHPARVEIVRLLLREGACACGEIVRRLPLAQSTVSQHLRHLRTAGLVKSTREGRRVCYRVNTGALERLGELVRVLHNRVEATG